MNYSYSIGVITNADITIYYLYQGTEVMPYAMIGDEDTIYVTYDELNRGIQSEFEGAFSYVTYTSNQIIVSLDNGAEADTFVLENGNIIENTLGSAIGSLNPTYDDKNNPFSSFTLRNLFAPYFESVLTDKAPFRYGVGFTNNILSQTSNSGFVTNYSYTYNEDDLPTQCLIAFPNDTIVYEYTYR